MTPERVVQQEEVEDQTPGQKETPTLELPRPECDICVSQNISTNCTNCESWKNRVNAEATERLWAGVKGKKS